MKSYVKPSLAWVELRVEERFATGSGCTVKGSCTEATLASYDAYLRSHNLPLVNFN
jgi:hypothetical protein